MVSSMRGKLATVAVFTVAVAACTTDGTPATTPSSTPTTTSTTTALPATPTTTVATTTTLDRRTEIEAIFQDLEERRLHALYEGDREAFQALFANPEYMTRSMGAFDMVEFVEEPSLVVVEVLDVLSDHASCIAAEVGIDATQSLGSQAVAKSIWVLELSASSDWGYSFGGEGWTCNGPHPFS